MHKMTIYDLIPARQMPRKRIRFSPTQRHHAPTWILLKIDDLVDKAKREKDSSKVLYACLEARNLLELIKFSKIQCSIPEDEREEVGERAAGRNGMDRENQKLKTLNQKYQDFFQAVSEDGNFPFPAFNSRECQNIFDKLHLYIHTYTVSEQDMFFASQYIQSAFPILIEAIRFAKSNMVFIEKNNTYAIANIDVRTLPDWARNVLNDWKQDSKNDYQRLKANISSGILEYNNTKELHNE